MPPEVPEREKVRWRAQRQRTRVHWPIVTIDERMPVKVLDDHARKALVNFLNRGREAGQIEPRRAAVLDARVLTGNFSVESERLQVDETRCALAPAPPDSLGKHRLTSQQPDAVPSTSR